MRFEWNNLKNELNIKKHNVSFEEAISIFEDINLIITDDFNHTTNNEERFIALGKSLKQNILFAVYCYRNEDLIRIISARKANKKERGI